MTIVFFGESSQRWNNFNQSCYFKWCSLNTKAGKSIYHVFTRTKHVINNMAARQSYEQLEALELKALDILQSGFTGAMLRGKTTQLFPSRNENVSRKQIFSSRKIKFLDV